MEIKFLVHSQKSIETEVEHLLREVGDKDLAIECVTLMGAATAKCGSFEAASRLLKLGRMITENTFAEMKDAEA